MNYRCPGSCMLHSCVHLHTREKTMMHRLYSSIVARMRVRECNMMHCIIPSTAFLIDISWSCASKCIGMHATMVDDGINGTKTVELLHRNWISRWWWLHRMGNIEAKWILVFYSYIGNIYIYTSCSHDRLISISSAHSSKASLFSLSLSLSDDWALAHESVVPPDHLFVLHKFHYRIYEHVYLYHPDRISISKNGFYVNPITQSCETRFQRRVASKSN